MFWQPKGAMVRNQLETFWKDIHLARGYDLLYTPHIAKVDLWKTSGHFEHYGENMFDQMTVRHQPWATCCGGLPHVAFPDPLIRCDCDTARSSRYISALPAAHGTERTLVQLSLQDTMSRAAEEAHVERAHRVPAGSAVVAGI